MWIFEMHDGTKMGTTSKSQCAYICEQADEHGGLACEYYLENLDAANEVVDYVIE